MSEFQKPKNKLEFEKNFEQIKPQMNETQAYYESSRCLFCYDAPCVTACPTHIDIPLFIRQINSGNITGAAKTIFESNYFGNTCGKVCPTNVLCEGACVYNLQDVKVIEIGRLQTFASSKAISEKIKLFSPGVPNGKKVAVIGAGPAGISCACELRSKGYEVEIFEAKEKPSGLSLYGVAPYKITNEEALKEIDYLQEQFDFKINYNIPVTSEEQFNDLEKKFDAIFLGIGLGETSSIKIKGEELENCIGAVEFISELRINQHNTKIGKKVIVLGGGNTAMDAASESARLGAEKVILSFRRSVNNLRAYDFEYDLAKSAGVEGMFNVSPVEITGNGKVEGVKFIRTKVVNSKMENIPGSEFIENCDMVIKATGQTKQVNILKNIKGLITDEQGRVIADKISFQSGNPKYFAAGDVYNGGVEVVNAVAEAKLAAVGIDKWLNS
ncbi:MAG TPA: FAD-dependent oxidoreductase [Ignavibacteria bacterium]|nr:FAD-dependent oxidoreductase [Ignavibacteria bacterium]